MEELSLIDNSDSSIEFLLYGQIQSNYTSSYDIWYDPMYISLQIVTSIQPQNLILSLLLDFVGESRSLRTYSDENDDT